MERGIGDQDVAGGASQRVPPVPSSETVAQQITRRAQLQRGEIMPSVDEQVREQERVRLERVKAVKERRMLEKAAAQQR